MEKILIDYAEFKRLVTQEIRLKEQIAAIEEDYEDLRLDYNRLLRSQNLQNGKRID